MPNSAISSLNGQIIIVSSNESLETAAAGRHLAPSCSALCSADIAHLADTAYFSEVRQELHGTVIADSSAPSPQSTLSTSTTGSFSSPPQANRYFPEHTHSSRSTLRMSPIQLHRRQNNPSFSGCRPASLLHSRSL